MRRSTAAAAAMAVAALLIILSGAPAGAGGQARASDLGAYHTYDEMVSELQGLASAHPGLANLSSLGTTWEGRDLWVLKVSDNVSADEAEPNLTVFGGIHARELVSVEVPLFIAGSLLENYSSNATVRDFVNGTQLWFFPMVNPDGHAWVEAGHDWRKNRRPTVGPNIGVDLNRNFGHLWGREAPADPSSEEYCGPGPFSENETRAVAELMTSHPPRFTLSYHAFGGYILYPWGNSLDVGEADLRLGEIAANLSLSMPEGRRYAPHAAREYYAATGDTDDWFFANLSVLPFTVELADQYRPLEASLPGIFRDNLGPVHYLLGNLTGAGKPLPRRSLELQGPGSFRTIPGIEAHINFQLANAGEAAEEVTLSLDSTSNWSLSLSHSTASLEPGTSFALFVIVTIPPGTEASRTEDFTLSAVSSAGTSARLVFRGTVDQFHALEVEMEAPSEAEAGSEAAVSVNVTNRGNGPESLALSASASTGWAISSLPYPLNLSAGAAARVGFNVSVPGKAVGGVSADITFTASTADGTHRARTARTLAVIAHHGLSLTISPRSLSFPEKENRTVTVRIVNSGNCWENGTLVLLGQGQARLETTNLSLPPWSSANVNLTLNGSRGNWSAEVRFSVGGGTMPGDAVRYDITPVKARPKKPAPPDPVPVMAALLAITVLVLGFIYWDARREERKRAEEEGPEGRPPRRRNED